MSELYGSSHEEESTTCKRGNHHQSPDTEQACTVLEAEGRVERGQNSGSSSEHRDGREKHGGRKQVQSSNSKDVKKKNNTSTTRTRTSASANKSQNGQTQR